MTSTFRDMILRVAPGWLRGAPSRNGKLDSVGSRYLYSIGVNFDWVTDRLVDGIRKRFPTYIAPGDSQPDRDALAMIGRDRTLLQGPSQTNSSYASQLIEWMDDLKMSGNAWATLRQLQWYLTPNNATIRLVNNWGIWYTLSPTFAQSLTISPTTVYTAPYVAGYPNWNWDDYGPWWPSAYPKYAWSRFWVIIYCNGGLPFGVGPNWGASSTWAAPNRTWGTTATPQHVKDIKQIVSQFKAGHSKCQNIIIAFDPNSFSPTAPGGSPLPDGTWGRWAYPPGTTFAGQQARLPTARYWDGPP